MIRINNKRQPPPSHLLASSSSKSPSPSPLLYSSYSPEPNSIYNHHSNYHLQSSSSSSLYNNISTTPSPTVSPLPPTDLPTADDNNNLMMITKPGPSEGKPKKRISFALPADEDIGRGCGGQDGAAGGGGGSSQVFNKLRNRRMSSPAIPNNSAMTNVQPARPKIPSLKMYKILDGLDLRSSVPLSPTRLYQSLGKYNLLKLILFKLNCSINNQIYLFFISFIILVEFPDLITWKAPTEKEKPTMIGITN